THYPLLLERLERLAPWPVTFVDPAPAIARRGADLSGPKAGGAPAPPARTVFTSGPPPAAAPPAALARFGRRGSGGFDEKLHRTPVAQAVSDSNGAQTALASPGPDSCDGAQNDGERLTDGATNRAVQIHAADGKFQPPCLAVEVGGAVLRGVRRSAHAPVAKRRRSGAVRS